MYQQFWKDLLCDPKLSNGHIVANCPICSESGGHFYANARTGLWDCKKCQAKGNPWSFLRDHKMMEKGQIVECLRDHGILRVVHNTTSTPQRSKVFDKKAIEYFSSCLSESQIQNFAQERGLSIEILKKHEIGINENGEFTLPVYDQEGKIRNILRKLPGGSTISVSGGESLIFGVEDLLPDDAKEVFVVEGPWAAMALKERGYNAVGTCGAGVLKDEQVPLFKGKEVFLVPDNDEAGKMGVQKIAQKLKGTAKYVHIISLPVSEKNDVRNYFQDGSTKEQFDDIINQARSTRLLDFPLSLPAFLDQDIPPIEFYVHSILPKKGKGMISAVPNVGKSIFAQNIALAVASGKTDLMGKFAVHQARVLYLDLEMGESALKERFQKMSETWSEGIENLFVKYVAALDLLNDDNKALIESWIEELKIEVLILDPLGNAWSGDESSQEEVGQLTRYLNTLIEKFGISIMVVHHWRKATKEFKTGGQMAAGSYKWAAWLDCHVTLEESSGKIIISSHKNRHGVKFNPYMAKLNIEKLIFEFLTDFETKFDETTLEGLFNKFEREKVAIPEIIKFAKENGGPSESTIRKLIKESSLFGVDDAQKTHYLVKKTSEVSLFNTTGAEELK